VVEKIKEDGTITIKNENKEKTFNIGDYNYVDHAYAVTVHKSQGMTVSRVLYDVSSKRANYNEVYTALTRGKLEYSIYTDSKQVFYDRMKHEQVKTSTLELSKSTSTEKTASSMNKTASAASSIEEENTKTATAGRAR
jgi:ATP-dependent exoDNAse (exonuclease V) alpha subunit